MMILLLINYLLIKTWNNFDQHLKNILDQNDEYSYLSLDCYCENEGRKIVHDVIDPEPLIDKNEHSTMSHLLEDTQISIDWSILDKMEGLIDENVKKN